METCRGVEVRVLGEIRVVVPDEARSERGEIRGERRGDEEAQA